MDAPSTAPTLAALSLNISLGLILQMPYNNQDIYTKEADHF